MIGFVYVLTNEYMPDVCKIGCTQRPPNVRAAELSRLTGVPVPFDVLCHIEVDGFQRVEQHLHAHLRQHRISRGREFFHGKEAVAEAVRWLWEHPQRGRFQSIYLPPARLPSAELALPREFPA